MLSILYDVYIILTWAIAGYLWFNRNQLLGLDSARSHRISHLFAPSFLVIGALTAGLLAIFGAHSLWPVVGLILGTLLVPILGLIVVNQVFHQ